MQNNVGLHQQHFSRTQ